jgi:hypothetical protein
MKVYVVLDTDGDILAIFSDQERARNFVNSPALTSQCMICEFDVDKISG